MGKSKQNPAQQVATQAQQSYQSSLTPSASESQFSGFAPQFMNNYNQAVQRNTQDYGNIMNQYQQFGANLGAPKEFSYQTVNAPTPKELNESYGYLREAMPGYRQFAATGGYSPTEMQDIRARGIAPIRAAYGNTMLELNRARALGGGGSGAPNYIAALARTNRDLSQGTSDAMQNVNAGLAESVRQGKEFGLQGISGTGSTLGGLSSQEAQRQLSASMANQSANLQAQSLTEQALEANRSAQLAAMGGQASLYGTTPGMASTFGNQAISGYGTLAEMQNARNQYGLGALNAETNAYGTNKGQTGTPWWRKALGAAAAGAATYFTGGALAPAAGGIYGAVAGA